jgi:hypothetical protein
MTDYLQPISRTWQIICVIGCLLAFLTCAFLDVVICMAVFRKAPTTHDAVPLGGAVLLFNIIGVIALYFGWRLLKGTRSSNGMTLVSTRSLQLFGLVFLTLSIFAAYLSGSIWYLFEGVSFSMVLFGMGGYIDMKRRREQDL